MDNLKYQIQNEASQKYDTRSKENLNEDICVVIHTETEPPDKGTVGELILHSEDHRRGSMACLDTKESFERKSEENHKIIDEQNKEDEFINIILDVESTEGLDAMLHKHNSLNVQNRNIVEQSEIPNILNSGASLNKRNTSGVVNNNDINIAIIKGVKNLTMKNEVIHNDPEDTDVKREKLLEMKPDDWKTDTNPSFHGNLKVESFTTKDKLQHNKHVPLRNEDTVIHDLNQAVTIQNKKDEKTQTSIIRGFKILEDESIPDYIVKRQMDFLNHIHQSEMPIPMIHQSDMTEPMIHQSGGTTPMIHQSERTGPMIHQSDRTDPTVYITEETSVKEIGEKETNNYIPEMNNSEPKASRQSKVAKVRPIVSAVQGSRDSFATDTQYSPIRHPESPETSRKIVTSYAARPVDSEMNSNGT